MDIFQWATLKRFSTHWTDIVVWAFKESSLPHPDGTPPLVQPLTYRRDLDIGALYENLFNLNFTYRRDLAISARYEWSPICVSLRYEDYYSTITSCKFDLAFQNSMHVDYITEKLNGPMVAGTVLIVSGPSRENYEQFIPADSFIHVDDFSEPKALAWIPASVESERGHVLYMRYFPWRLYFRATPHLLSTHDECTQPICAACDQNNG